MTDKEIKAEAERYYKRYSLVCDDSKESFITGFQLGYRDGQIDGLSTVLKPK